ncbi:efflux RND transporter periplasmic adaptor subunit [Denitromonas iodatirespirans]|uniref:Efflux RND transporter periplasmic adaptor subunit n=1 Tax=Denitromonas iodatirespirans TaxID=2795389 RepID=A0A944DP10_DENI1|nr:efflux RND transporter periplasmic adaptor subunit [Denitromonas iodatirespirans]MBT0962074.1 efflux RND transporter periplasmic adaptor subunit [Denitromonas iodatirespirans]
MRARRLLIALCLIAAAGAAVWWIKRPTPIPVALATVERGRVEATVSNTRAGEIEACQRAKLSTIAGGRIDYLGVKEGDKVQAGQVLMRLWNEDQNAQIEVAQRQLDTVRRRVAEACTVATNARREATRQSALRAQGFVSESAEEKARTEAEAREAACRTSQADVAAAQAQLDAARANTARTVLVAPFDGTVAKIVGELGEYSTPSPPGVPTPPAIDLIDERCLYVKAPMDEVDAPKIHAGQPVRITLDALPGQVFAGHVRRVAPYVFAVEKQARTVDVEVDFDHPEEARGLLVGYSADAEVILQVRDDVLRVPTAALRSSGDVLRYDAASGTLVAQPVKTGIANWEQTEITDGLEEGDRIVTSLEREGIAEGAAVAPDADMTQ